MVEISESTERMEGVGDAVPEDRPLGPYWGRFKGTKCSWLQRMRRKSIWSCQRAEVFSGFSAIFPLTSWKSFMRLDF
jgi:hypothetical protein